MIVEQRTYTLHPHIPAGEFLKAYERLGFDVQRRILSGFLGYYTTEFGVLNRVTHLWAFRDLEDRRVRRAALAANADWQECIETVRPMLKEMHSEILYPTAFSDANTRLPVDWETERVV